MASQIAGSGVDSGFDGTEALRACSVSLQNAHAMVHDNHSQKNACHHSQRQQVHREQH